MSEELSDAQLGEIAEDLRALQEELGSLLEMSKDGVKPVDLDEPIGRISRMDAIQQQKMAASNREASKVRLRQVGTALAAIEQNDYGCCSACEEPIAFRRLKAKPEARMCIRCQGARERTR